VVNQFSLTPARWESSDGISRPWLDFVIDGVPLNQSVRRDVSVLVTDLGAARLTVEVDRLLLRGAASFADGGQALYDCPLCGDLGCGAVSARIDRDGRHIVWREFSWRTDYEPEPVETYPDLGPFRFDADQYTSALLGVRAHLP
jgi:hypothetical protein